MALFSKQAFGLDLGDRSIEAMQLSGTPSKPSFVSYGRTILPGEIIEKGKIVSKDQLRKAILQTLENAKPRSIKDTTAVITIPDLLVYTTVVSVPDDSSEIPDTKLVLHEAQNSVPVSLENATFDMYEVETPDKLQKHFFFAAVEQEQLAAYIEVLKELDIDVQAVDFEPLSATRAIWPENIQKKWALLDIGANKTSFTAFQGRKAYFNASTTVAGDKFTMALAEGLKTTGEEAEKIKRAMQKDQKAIGIIQGQLELISREVNNFLDYTENKLMLKPESILLTGGSSLMPGLPEWIQNWFAQRNIKIEIAAPYLNLGENAPSYQLYLNAMGLALRTLQPNPVAGFNLLMTRDKKMAKAILTEPEEILRKDEEETETIPELLQERPEEEEGVQPEEEAKTEELKQEEQEIQLEPLVPEKTEPSKEKEKKEKPPRKPFKLTLPRFLKRKPKPPVTLIQKQIPKPQLALPSKQKKEKKTKKTDREFVKIDISAERKRLKILIILFCIAVAALAIALLYKYGNKLSTDQITDTNALSEPRQTISIGFSETVSQDTPTVGRIISTRVTKEYEVIASGEGEIEEYATGEAIVYNDTNIDQTIVTQSRLITEDGTLFRTQSRLEIPAESSVKVTIKAAEKGAEGNIKPQTLTFVALPDTLTSLIYAKTTESLTGGVRQSTTISQSDITTQAQAQIDYIKENPLSEIQWSDLVDLTTFSIVPEFAGVTVKKTSCDDEPGSEVQSTSCRAAYEVIAVVVGKPWLNKEKAQRLNDSLVEGEAPEMYELAEESFSIENYNETEQSVDIIVELIYNKVGQ